MKTPPRRLDLRDGDDIVGALREFARDVVASLTRVPEVLYREIEVKGGDTDVDVTIPWTVSPGEVRVGWVRDLDADADITNAIWTHWQWRGGKVRLRTIVGLTASTRYRLRLVITEAV